MSEEQSTEPIAEIEAQGWDWFEEQAKKSFRDENAMDQEEIISHFQKCFSTPSGQIVLNYLEEITINTVDFDPSLGFHDGAAFGYFRSGQKWVYREIKKLLNIDLTKKSERK